MLQSKSPVLFFFLLQIKTQCQNPKVQKHKMFLFDDREVDRRLGEEGREEIGGFFCTRLAKSFSSEGGRGRRDRGRCMPASQPRQAKQQKQKQEEGGEFDRRERRLQNNAHAACQLPGKAQASARQCSLVVRRSSFQKCKMHAQMRSEPKSVCKTISQKSSSACMSAPSLSPRDEERG